MQRLDDQYLMRHVGSAAAQAPAERIYARELLVHDAADGDHASASALEVTLEMINAETQLLFSSDWPHFDFDLPATIYDLPFLTEQAKRNILGLNAARIFHLDPTPRKKL